MPSKIKKVLVTGAAGFLGSHLSEKLVELGHTVIGIDNKLGGYQDNVPKGVEFPLDAIVINSCVVICDGVIPPEKTPLVELERPQPVLLADVRSPKSTSLPVVAISMKSMTLDKDG